MPAFLLEKTLLQKNTAQYLLRVLAESFLTVQFMTDALLTMMTGSAMPVTVMLVLTVILLYGTKLLDAHLNFLLWVFV